MSEATRYPGANVGHKPALGYLTAKGLIYQADDSQHTQARYLMDVLSKIASTIVADEISCLFYTLILEWLALALIALRSRWAFELNRTGFAGGRLL